MSNVKTYHIITYGCQMNVHESEKIAGILEYLNYQQTDDINVADVIFFNTCCIRDTAEKRAIGNIGALKPLKKMKPNVILGVLGCMPQQPGFIEKFQITYPHVDIILGTASIDKLLDIIPEIENKRVKIRDVDKNTKPSIVENEKFFRTSYPNAWVNITYGCNNFCSFCIVPYVRGRERSRDLTNIVDECKSLVDEGYKEITLLGQNVNSYGNDFTNDTSFYSLLNEIDKINGKFRVRFMTSHPKDFNNDVIDVIANSQKICNFIHLPVQAGSNSVLKKMNRRYTREHYFSIINSIKSKIPDCGLSTDLMVGFPYETEEDFQDTMDLVKRVQFTSAFTFIYSPRKGTKAAEFEQIPYEIKQDRIARLIKLQNQISKNSSSKLISTTSEVLCEGIVDKKPGYACGRTTNGRMVSFKGDKLLIGNFINVKINKVKNSSLEGEIVK